jgi:hypothetical protein
VINCREGAYIGHTNLSPLYNITLFRSTKVSWIMPLKYLHFIHKPKHSKKYPFVHPHDTVHVTLSAFLEALALYAHMMPCSTSLAKYIESREHFWITSKFQFMSTIVTNLQILIRQSNNIQKSKTSNPHNLKWDWTMHSKYDNHSRFINQHNSKGPIWPFNEHKNLHFDMKDVYIISFE